MLTDRSPNEHYPFSLKPLPYSYDALEPYIDAATVQIHHDRHLKSYVDNLNNTLDEYPQYHSWSLERLLKSASSLPAAIRTAVINNGGGVYNHNLYFDALREPGGRQPEGVLKNALMKAFGSMENFETEMKKAGVSVFGSGYAWLVSDGNGKLKIITTANQDTPLPLGLCPILPLDVWEHAYYLKYQNRRPDAIDGWFNLINWEQAEKNYIACMLRNR
jgi:Superoxide dismutase